MEMAAEDGANDKPWRFATWRISQVKSVATIIPELRKTTNTAMNFVGADFYCPSPRYRRHQNY
jgi:hypothetical protein